MSSSSLPRVSLGLTLTRSAAQVKCRGDSTLGQGARVGAPLPDSLVDPSPTPDSKLADRSDVISEVLKCFQIQILRCLVRHKIS